MEEEKNFCTMCGEKLKEYETGRFDAKTGLKRMSKQCENIKCEDGCGNITHHNNWSAFRNKCRNCGHVACDIY